ncbi:phosphoserine phosphatase SerB [Sansalvadorimonas sp. 2012CJ34-2]|uniref:Phosphoserine phosphatase n=1 Tax=Parendozoicomonas callyspongiae TaxID=2942213 RepID=A0ABT0PE99_9GAMM|nr:phosphoserine phosphatase SerB [Sansalvadorimonas sp. 2012CJ34-2]MCL6269633.1 phosphoserine phosphatase SerB [Sansalvadorimonas sp. 2012CJ34-2]
MSRIVLINVTGEDKPGLTSAITGIMAGYGVEILDIGQAVIHDSLTWGILVRVPREDAVAPVLKDLLFHLHEKGLQVTYRTVQPFEYEEWTTRQEKDRYKVTLLSRAITAEQMSQVSAVTAAHGLNIDNITRLSGRVPLEHRNEVQRSCIEFSVRGTPADTDQLKADFLHLSSDLDVDIALQEDSIYRRSRRLVVFDMDSTLIEAEVIDELAKEAGVGDQVTAITEEAMQGNLDFQESFRRRLSLLKGLDESALPEVANRLKLTEGAERLITTLKTLGYKTAIVSGGFTWFARFLQEKLGIDYIYANELEIIDGRVTGEVRGEIVDASRKAVLLKEIAKQEHIRLEQVIAVGDGANDLQMLAAAGLGIAFRAKPLVRQSARQSISTLGLDSILYLLGWHDRDLAQLALP